ncbi:MAG TPA: NAD-dependent epimerase/dehydratase family protein [Casimicrobiaceae bacterium]|nr:NAD-dependent epimerase/dehydratase family protein [Casimicrobiaceae bacterium]
MVLEKKLVAVTGANGFIGSAYCRRIEERGGDVRRLVRDRPSQRGDVVALDLARAPSGELERALEGVHALVHLAGRAHAMSGTERDADATYRAANVDITERIALAAIASGVRRFVLASTIKVNGEATLRGKPFKCGDEPAPQDAYARSKLAAERTLAQVAGGTSMIATSLRLPLVYGPNARGNFRRLVDAVAAQRPLPLGAIENRRSLLSLDNLMDAFDAAIDAPHAPIGTYLVADADSVSTPTLVRAIASALGVAPRLLAVPVPLLRMAGALCRKGDAIARLTRSLEVDTSSFSRATGWRPRPFAIDPAYVAGAARDL